MSVGFEVLVGRATDAQNKVKALYRKRFFDQTDQEWQKSIEVYKAESAKYSFINVDSLNSVFYLVGSVWLVVPHLISYWG